MVKPLVLVDFDGVVLKNARAGQYVKNRIGSYIERHTGIRDRRLIDSLNKELYTSHGHTLTGLRKHGFQVTLKDFNKYLYGDRKAYEDLELLPDEVRDWKHFLREMQENDMNVKLFSNSGIEWMTHFIGYNSDLLEFHEWVDSNLKHEQAYNQILKPERNIYDLVKYKYPKSLYYFIDDKVSNFTYVHNDNRWMKLWMNNDPHDQEGLIKLGNMFYCINDLPRATQLILRNR